MATSARTRPTPAAMPQRRPAQPARPAVRPAHRCGCGARATEPIELDRGVVWYCYPCS